MHIDFLIVAALEDEAVEIERLLVNPQRGSTMVVGSINRWQGQGQYRVGLIDLFGMGTLNAQLVTQDTIGSHKPRAVMMTGIAAGFLDSHAKVRLGDLMVPYGVVSYESAKLFGDKRPEKWRARFRHALQEARSLPRGTPFLERVWMVCDIMWGKSLAARVEHRGVAWAVADSLFRCAMTTKGDVDKPWLQKITAKRPQGVDEVPTIHGYVDAIIGCGEKVVADREAEVRRWLLECYPRQAMGLEMESLGALVGCRAFDTPFLMAKASVDRATVEKDDNWRSYACQLSAAFLLTVLERYQRPATQLVQRHRQESAQAAEQIVARLPNPDFGCRIKIASSFEQLRQRAFQHNEAAIDELLPNDVSPAVVLYGGGGSGKSTIARRLFVRAQAKDVPAVLINLKRQPKLDEPIGDAELEKLIYACSLPRRTAEEIIGLAEYDTVTLIIDATNEVSKRIQSALAGFCEHVNRVGRCQVLWMNRVSPLDGLPGQVVHAIVSKVAVETARQRFNETFDVKYDTLSPQLQRIMQRPFFLDLAIRARRPFTERRLWSGIFHEFFREHRALAEEELNALAVATLESIAKDGRPDVEQLQARAPMLPKLAAADIRIVDASGEFEHHLWRDYLLARALSLDALRWTNANFDSATTFGTSAESLLMTVEQLPGPEDKSRFVKAVYDWNYTAALECVAFSDPDEPIERQLPQYLRTAILAVVAEKLLDQVPRTAQRTSTILSQYPFAREFLVCEDRASMVAQVATVNGDVAWFNTWKQTYVKGAGAKVDGGDIALLASEDSLLGWTAANFARRGQLDPAGQERIRESYLGFRGDRGHDSVRWRLVHVLGRWPTEENVRCLAESLSTDPYHWVQYGAARSLVEIAARSREMRVRAMETIRAFVKSEGAGGSVRHLILEEIIETSFIRDATVDWPEASAEFLYSVVDAEMNSDRRSRLSFRMASFPVTPSEKGENARGRQGNAGNAGLQKTA